MNEPNETNGWMNERMNDRKKNGLRIITQPCAYKAHSIEYE